jgi:hypothetical protein
LRRTDSGVSGVHDSPNPRGPIRLPKATNPAGACRLTPHKPY